VAVALQGEARVLLQLERDDERRQVLRRLADIRSRRAGDDNEFMRLYYAAALDTEHPEASRRLEEALALAVEIYGRRHPMVIQTLVDLSQALSEIDRLDEAVARGREAR